MVKPITPDEIASAKGAYLPDAVITVFNTLIAKHWSGGEARIGQNEAVSMICEALHIDKHEVFSRKLLDVEDVYRANGWSVLYDKPGWDETYEAYFVFDKASRR